MVSVRILCASEHHSTQEIAEEIAGRLERAGHDTNVGTLRTGAEPLGPPHDALVIGSAVHDGAWLPAAEKFVRGHAARMADQPVWMFSVGMTAALPRPMRRLAERAEQPRIAALVDLVRPRDHRRFSGVIRREHLDRKGALLFRLCGARYGDHRDPAAVDAWADGISRALWAAGTGSGDDGARGA
ncbi:flavodoxin domain-containing protein [Streptomyces sp. NPDC048338]|uniref:flavodoxin domain-containing protein n=1 Tax=Streptomyces sp. NPDC048338 TaxID=3365536 RepID=UPI0037179A35